jgi:hypothetical protein
VPDSLCREQSNGRIIRPALKTHTRTLVLSIWRQPLRLGTELAIRFNG